MLLAALAQSNSLSDLRCLRLLFWRLARDPQAQLRGDALDLVPNPFDVLEHVIVPKTEHGYSFAAQPLRPTCVMSLMRLLIVLTAVDFNGELQRRTIKVDNVFAERMLATKT